MTHLWAVVGPYVYTVIGTAAAIILAEILGNYGLGDLVKDAFLRLFGRVSSFAESRYRRAVAFAARFERKH